MVWYDEYLKDNPTTIGEFLVAWYNDKKELHRLDGPAIIYKDGEFRWYKNNKGHRENGPAIFYSTGCFYFLINGDDITDEVLDWIEENNYPEWKNEDSWDTTIRMHFKLTFVK